LTNVVSLLRGGGLVSLSDVNTEIADRLPVTQYAYEVLALAQGELSRRQILGEFVSPWWKQAEGLLMAAVLTVVGILVFRRWRESRLFRLVGLMTAGYVAVAILVYVLPRQTFVHHWILGTPFQYGAIAMAVAACGAPGLRASFTSRALGVLVVLVLAVRLPNMVTMEKALAAGMASDRFDPSFTRIGDLAAERSGDSVFIAADWGTGTQVYCLGNGQDDLIYEPFWNADPAATIREIAGSTGKSNIYTLTTGIAPQFQAASTAIHQTLASLPGWSEAPVEPEFRALRAIQVRKFVRR
jgi:hypothetical protein